MQIVGGLDIHRRQITFDYLDVRNGQSRRGRIAPNYAFHFGLVLAGWGIFNVVEGLIDHHLLGVHHVRDDLGAPLSWDLGFLAFGLGLIAAGWALHRRGAEALASRT